jgi:hypothetical protein
MQSGQINKNGSAFLFPSLKAPRPASLSGVIHICVCIQWTKPPYRFTKLAQLSAEDVVISHRCRITLCRIKRGECG